MFSPSSRGRLTGCDLDRFPDNTLFHRVARAVCHAGCLPRKELYEAWEMARRVRRLFRGGRVIDLGAGHGLLVHHAAPRRLFAHRARDRQDVAGLERQAAKLGYSFSVNEA